MNTTILERATLDSPVGPLHVVARDGVLCAISFGHDWTRDERWLERRFGRVAFAESADPAGVVSALKRYFDGDVHALDLIPAEPGGTPFQARVWTALRTIPTGETISYAELARRIDSPTAVRAVGAANGANPVPLVIPCHRVIGSNARLVGYGGGLDRKAWLLQHEGITTGLLFPLTTDAAPSVGGPGLKTRPSWLRTTGGAAADPCRVKGVF